jgi:hypothetical protein
MAENTDLSKRAFQELVRILEEAVEFGADSIELEWDGQDLMVFHNFANTGLGAARIPHELQQPFLEEIDKRARLSRKPRGTMEVRLRGKDYQVTVEEYDSFGECAFHLSLKEQQKRKKKAGG